MRTSSKLIQQYFHVRMGHKLSGIISQVDTVSLIAARLLGADFTAVFYCAENNDRLIPVSYQYGHHLSVRHFDLLEKEWGEAQPDETNLERKTIAINGGDDADAGFGARNGFAVRYQFPLYDEGRLNAVFLAYWYEAPAAVTHDTEVMLDLAAGVLTAALSIADQLLVVENYSTRLSDLLAVFETPMEEVSFKRLVSDTMARAALLLPESQVLTLTLDPDSKRLRFSESFGETKLTEAFINQVIALAEPITLPGAEDTGTHRYRPVDIDPGSEAAIGDLVALTICPSDDIRIVLVAVVPENRTLSPNDRELLSVFAVFAQTVLRNALLFKSLRKANHLLEHSSDRLADAETMAALTDMTSGMAHDFNNIFGGIIGRIQLLRLKEKDSKLAAELGKIEQGALEGAETIRRLQEFSTSGRTRDGGPVDAVSALGEALADESAAWKSLASQKSVSIDSRILVDSASLIGVHSELITVVAKLIENAIEHSPEQATVSVMLEADDRSIFLRVADRGDGVPDSIRPRIFYPFFTTKSSRGAGLGLSIVHGIVSRHGGSVTVEDTAGGGATFVVSLPSAEGKREGSVIRSRPGGSNKYRILVVDDDDQIRSVLSDMLTINGHKTIACADGYAALRAIEKGSFDILITDLGMPGMSGLDLAGVVHEKFPDMPIAMITGWGTQLNDEEVALKGIRAVLPKPFHLKEIKQLVADLGAA